MSHVIITFILIGLAAKEKAQAKDNLTNPACREQSVGKREVANKRANHEKMTSHLRKKVK